MRDAAWRCQRLDANIYAATRSTPTNWRPGGRVARRHLRECRLMTNGYPRTSGHSILGLAVFDRSALHAEATSSRRRLAPTRVMAKLPVVHGPEHGHAQRPPGSGE